MGVCANLPPPFSAALSTAAVPGLAALMWPALLAWVVGTAAQLFQPSLSAAARMPGWRWAGVAMVGLAVWLCAGTGRSGRLDCAWPWAWRCWLLR